MAGGLDGCGGELINAVPTEIDSNAAASVFISARFPAHEVQALRTGPRRFLACSLIPPAPHDTLIARMVAFAYVYCAGVEANATRRAFPVEAILRSVRTDAPGIWSKLARHALIRLRMVIGLLAKLVERRRKFAAASPRGKVGRIPALSRRAGRSVDESTGKHG